MSSTVFVDSSVLFAAMLSSTGSARDLIRLAIRGDIVLCASSYVLREVADNLARKYPSAALTFEEVMQQIDWQMVEPGPEEVWAAAAYTALKDAPVVAAARKARCDYLVTYDRKHLLEPQEVSRRSGLAIVTPDVVVSTIQDDDAGN